MRLRIPRERSVDYQFPRDNGSWPDHRLRTRITAEIIAWLEPETVVDPAAGDGSIVAMAHSLHPIPITLLGDVALPNIERMQDISAGVQTLTQLGPAEDTIRLLEDGQTDLIVLTEFLEHVEDPEGVLHLARQKARRLVASSPIWSGVADIDPNPEHRWMFTAVGFEDLLVTTGWRPIAMVPLYFETMYDFQIWVAEAA